MLTKSEIHKKWLEIPEKKRINEINKAMHSVGGGQPIPHAEAKRRVYEKFKQDLIDKERGEYYQKGADGCCKWMEENMRVKIIPKGSREYVWVYLKELPDDKDEYGRSWKTFWDKQQEVLHEALETDSNGMYKNSLLAFVLPRSFGKSFLVIGISLYRAFNFTYQKLYLSANTKQQANIMHFDEAKAAIINSPKLIKQVGMKNILSDRIRLQIGAKNDVNIITTVTNSGKGSGLCSNASIVTMSEAYAMEDDSFFAELSGSIRGIEDAMCLIDTTASRKSHWLHDRVYRGALKHPDSGIYVKYIGIDNIGAKFFWNPKMTTKELKKYEITLTRYDYERFFKNQWGTKKIGLFDKDTIEAISYLGAEGMAINHKVVLEKIELIRNKSRVLDIQEYQLRPEMRQIDADKLRSDLMRVDDYFNLGGYHTDDETTIASPTQWPKMQSVKAVTDVLMVDRFALLVGVDRAEPGKKGTTGAKTVIVWMAKIPAGKVFRGLVDDPYLYLLLGVAMVGNHLTAPMTKISTQIHDEFGIDSYGGDKYSGGEMGVWCDSRGIQREFTTATLTVQQAGYGELINAIHNGLFKAPPIPVSGVRSGDILREELSVFDQIGRSKATGQKRYGSPEKTKRDGIQDDVLDAICMAIYAGRGITTDRMKDKFSTQKKQFSYLAMIPGSKQVQEVYRGLYGK